MWFLALLMAPTADALTHPRSGLSFDLAAGAQLALPPVTGAASGYGSIGWWDGKYDDGYAIGRYWSVHASGRADFSPGHDLRITPMVEGRRGLDLVVVGWYFGLAGGPVVAIDEDTSTLGGSARLVFGGEFRRTRFWGLTARLEAGPDLVGQQASVGGALLLGFQFSRPVDGQPVD